MNLDEARSEAVQGAWLTADHMQPGSYLSYAFAGWRINFPGGSSSGFTPLDADEAADWRIVGPVEVPRPAPAPSKWGKAVECAPFTGPEADAYHKTLPPIESGWTTPRRAELDGFSTPVVKNPPKSDGWGRPK